MVSVRLNSLEFVFENSGKNINEYIFTFVLFTQHFSINTTIDYKFSNFIQ